MNYISNAPLVHIIRYGLSVFDEPKTKGYYAIKNCNIIFLEFVKSLDFRLYYYVTASSVLVVTNKNKEYKAIKGLWDYLGAYSELHN